MAFLRNVYMSSDIVTPHLLRGWRRRVEPRNKCGVTKLFIIFLLFLIAFLYANIASAREEIKLYEQEIKAGLLYNFLKYTNWPEQTSSEISVCIFGPDPFDGYLRPMEGRSVNQSSIRIHNINSINELSECNMLFVSEAGKPQWPDIRKAIGGKTILTVSDIKGFAQTGGMIEFDRKDGRISVNLNQDAVNESKLSVQERLLNLVTIVKGGH